MKRLLVVAYYFPPLGMGGVQRVVKWAKYLPQFGWEPHILSVKPIRYYAYDSSLLEEIQGISIDRTESWDLARLAERFFRKKAPRSSPKSPSVFPGQTRVRPFFLPDSKIGWYPFARKSGIRFIQKIRPDAILTTSPPLTAHLVGLELKKKSALPWVADFRDYWLGGEYVHVPTPLHAYFHRRWARQVLRRADAVVAISEPILESLRIFEPNAPSKFHFLPNGFDPADLRDLKPLNFPKKTLLYLGTLGGANHPGLFFEGLRLLVRQNKAALEGWEILFWGQPLKTVEIPAEIRPWIRRVPYTSHRESLAALLGAAGLLFFLAPTVNRGMVTGKIFEYVAAGRPIFAVLPSDTAAATILEQYGYGKTVTKLNAQAVAHQLEEFLSGKFKPRNDSKWNELKESFSRKKQTEKLAAILGDLVSREK